MTHWFGLALLLLLLPLSSAHAQRAGYAAPLSITLLLIEVSSPIGGISAQQGRDRLAGAGYGLAIGAVTGAVGFAGFTYLANRGQEGEAYWPLGLLVGSVAGGTAGLLIGAIIGAPEREEFIANQARLMLSPTPAGGITAGLAFPLPMQGSLW